MPRPPRICIDGALYHIVVWGNNRQEIFLDDRDHKKYLKLLRKYKSRYQFLLYAYILMPDHIYLTLQTSSQGTISQIMHSINTAYTRYFNSRYNRSGHVFQGRYKSLLVEKDLFLLTLTRHIHLSPVRQRLASLPEEYPWSSYRSYLTSNANLVNIQEVLKMLGDDIKNRIKLYREFVQSGLSESSGSLERLVQEQLFLGSESFIEEIKSKMVNTGPNNFTKLSST
jgi:REP element-mobilizing transposase RayT